MPQTYPFTRAKSLGYAFGEIFPSSGANTIDANAAQAADGLHWSDFAQLRNWRTGTVSNITKTGACAWDPTKYCWFVAGQNGTTPQAGYAFASGAGIGADLASSGTVAAGAGLTVGFAAACVAPDGSWLFGGTPASGSAQKIRRSTDSGANWAVQSTVAAGTTGVNVLHKFAASTPLAIAGLTNGNIETSPDGITWTNRTVPNSSVRGSAASNSSVVVVTSSGSTDKIITSPDGITWTERTLPASSVWRVAYSSVDAKFLAVCATSIASSTDGITWSTLGLTLPSCGAASGAGYLSVIKRAWVAHDVTSGYLYGSVDGGATWRPLAVLSTGAYCWGVGDSAILAVDGSGSTNNYIQTLALGGR